MMDIEISKRFRLFKPPTSCPWPYSVNREKILVIFLPWLNSKEKHVNKYVQPYLDIGLDVLCAKSKYLDFLWPPSSFGAIRELAEVLKKYSYDHYLFHSVSIGSFNFTTFRVMAKDMLDVSDLNKKVCGIIYDSIVIGGGRGGAMDKSDVVDSNHNSGDSEIKAIDRFVKGIADSIQGSKFILPVLSLTAKLYFSLTKKQTLDYYEKAYGVVVDEPSRVPTLVYASENDPMCDKDIVKQLVRKWRDEYDIPVTLQMWGVSGHAQHLVFHRKEYLDVQRKFFDEVFGELDKKNMGTKKSFQSRL